MSTLLYRMGTFGARRRRIPPRLDRFLPHPAEGESITAGAGSADSAAIGDDLETETVAR